MVEIDGNGRDGGGRGEDIPLTYSPSFHFFYFSLFLSFSPSFFLASLFSFSLFFCNYFFFFFKDTSKFQKSLHEIRIWRSCSWRFEESLTKCEV